MNIEWNAEGERDLVARLRAGDELAAELLVRQYGGRMLSVARRMLRCEEDARDAVQEAFLCAFRSLAGFEESAGIGTWLHRIVVNAALMRLRSAKRRPETPIEPLLPQFDDTGHHVDMPRPWALSAEAALAQREILDHVRAAIEKLPDAYRTVLLLREIEELSTDEVAALLGITPTAVKLRLHRARLALRQLCDPIMRSETYSSCRHQKGTKRNTASAAAAEEGS